MVYISFIRLRPALHWQYEKLREVQEALERDPVDIETIRKHAISNGGLVNNEMRKKAWPKMVGVSVCDISPYDGKLGGIPPTLPPTDPLQPRFVCIRACVCTHVYFVFVCVCMCVCVCVCVCVTDTALSSHKDRAQVQLDVNRCHRRLPKGTKKNE